MECKYWTGILRILIPELTRDTCYLISLNLNVSDIYLLVEALQLPTCWPVNMIGMSCFYDNLELLKLAISRNYIPTNDINNLDMRYHPNGIQNYFIINTDSRVNQYLKPIQVYTPRFYEPYISKYKLEETPSNEMRYIKNLCFEDVKKLQPECVSLYFHFNRYFYDLNSDDWKWIYETCKNTQYFKKTIYSQISVSGAEAALKLGFNFSETLYHSYYDTLYNKLGEEIENNPNEEFLEFLIKHVPINEPSFIVHNLLVLKRVHMKIKIWKRTCLQIAFKRSCEETIELLHSKKLKTNKSCISALEWGNIRALQYEIEYIKSKFSTLDLLKYVYHKHTLLWILDNFNIEPCSFHRNNNMSSDALHQLQYRGFIVNIKTIPKYI